MYIYHMTSNPSLVYSSQRNEASCSHINLDMNVHSSFFFFVLVKSWKQHKCHSVGEWKKKMWYIHTMGHYSAIRTNKLLRHTTTWMELKSIMLSGKEASLKRLHTVWFCLYNIFERTKLEWWRLRQWLLGVGVRGG